MQILKNRTPMQQKLILGTIAMIVAQSGYAIVQFFTASDVDLTCFLDNMIPFVPWTITIYMFIFPFVLIACALVDIEDFFALMACSLMACVTGWVFFLLTPASISRPDPNSIDNFLWRWGFQILHKLDSPTNTCPSLHVAISWCCALGLLKKPSFWWGCVIAIAISISTLTTKQHFVVDVVAGFLLAVACWLLAVKWDVFKLKRFSLKEV